jgi:5-methylcytosine-specific restriction protein A
MDGVPKKPDVKRSPHWPAARRAWLKKHPTCAATGITTDLEVHHKKPFHDRPELELDESNFITLTEHASMHAHLWIGHLGNWKSYNTHVEEDAALMLKRIQNRPATGGSGS